MMFVMLVILKLIWVYVFNFIIKVGFVILLMGLFVGFVEVDDYILEGLCVYFVGGVINNGKIYNIEIIKKDS